MKRLLSLLLKLGLLICLIVSLAPQAKQVVSPYYHFDVPSHFIVQWTVFSLLAGIIFVYLGQSFWIAVSIFTTLLNVVIIGLQFVPAAPSADPNLPTVKFMLANLNARNQKPELLAKVLDQEDPDFITFLEVNTKWANLLVNLKRYYPHSYQIPLEGEYGIATYSKIPLAGNKVEFISDPQVPTVTNLLAGQDGAIVLISTHAPFPSSQESFTKRNEHLRKLKERIKTATSPTIILGDLNTTVFSPSYKAIIGDSSLRNARQGFGILPTWPMPFIPIAIGIDHVLVTPEFSVIDCHSTESIGSDHKPLIAKIAFKGFSAISRTQPAHVSK